RVNTRADSATNRLVAPFLTFTGEQNRVWQRTSYNMHVSVSLMLHHFGHGYNKARKAIMNKPVRHSRRQSCETCKLHKDYRKSWLCIVLLLALVLVSLASCGTHTTASSTFTGTGMGTPQPGTNGKPMVSPTGHWESI